jgi:hypothetical protein
MRTVLLPPGVNPIAVKYYTYPNFSRLPLPCILWHCWNLTFRNKYLKMINIATLSTHHYIVPLLTYYKHIPFRITQVKLNVNISHLSYTAVWWMFQLQCLAFTGKSVPGYSTETELAFFMLVLHSLRNSVTKLLNSSAYLKWRLCLPSLNVWRLKLK